MKKIPFLLLEIIGILFLAAMLIIFGISKYNDFFNHYSKYSVKFKDIDGLCVGSPVRFAGLHVGHVIKQELKDNKIIVIFKITDRNIKIPEGSVAGIEFTGLVGSKSLEIKPPQTKNDNGKELYSINPVRVNSFKEVMTVLSESSLDFSRDVLSFLGKNEKNVKSDLKNTGNLLKEKAILLEQSNEQIKTFTQNGVDNTRELKEILQETNENIASAHKTLNKLINSDEVQNNIEKVKEISDFIENGEVNKKIQEVNENVENIDKKIKKFNGKVSKIKDKELKYINEFNESLKNAAEKIQRLAKSIKEKASEK